MTSDQPPPPPPGWQPPQAPQYPQQQQSPQFPPQQPAWNQPPPGTTWGPMTDADRVGQQPPGPPTPWYGKGWVIGPVCLIVGLLAGLGIGSAVRGGDSGEATSQTPTTVVVTSTAAPTSDPTPAAETSTAPSTEPPTEPPFPDEPTNNGSADSPLAFGESARVGKAYNVSILGVLPNGNDIVAGANMFNDPPKGQYVVAQIKTTYVGNKEGDPWLDLSFRYVGTDARQYAEYDCGAVLPHDSGDVPTLENGGKATFQICFDMPPKAIQGGQLFVEDSLSFSGNSRVYWVTS